VPEEADREVDVMPNTGCTVAELKAMLQKDHNVPWAVASSKSLKGAFYSKTMLLCQQLAGSC
jgi:hypothetical protein